MSGARGADVRVCLVVVREARAKRVGMNALLANIGRHTQQQRRRAAYLRRGRSCGQIISSLHWNLRQMACGGERAGAAICNHAKSGTAESAAAPKPPIGSQPCRRALPTGPGPATPHLRYGEVPAAQEAQQVHSAGQRGEVGGAGLLVNEVEQQLQGGACVCVCVRVCACARACVFVNVCVLAAANNAPYKPAGSSTPPNTHSSIPACLWVAGHHRHRVHQDRRVHQLRHRGAAEGQG